MILTIFNYQDAKVYQTDMTEESDWNKEWEHDDYKEFIFLKGFDLETIEWFLGEDEGVNPINELNK